MKKLFIILLPFFMLWYTNMAHSQGYFEGGFKAGLWLQTDGLNSAINDYNNQRTWIKTKLNPVSGGTGGRFVFGRSGNDFQKFGLAVDIEWMRNEQTVSGIDPATGKMSYERLIVHYGGFGFGPTISAVHNEHTDVMFGADFNVFNYLVIRTQQNPNEVFEFNNIAKEQEAYNGYDPSINLFARFSLFAGAFGIAVTPKIDIPFLGSNEVGGLGKAWGINLTKPDATMYPINLNINFSIIICPNRGD